MCENRARAVRHAMTLIELMLVMAIMAILLTVSIPLIRPAFKDRELREAARQLNALVAGAKAQAAETGRSVGIWIERVDSSELGSRQSRQIFQCEVAPAYTGDLLDSRATVVQDPSTGLFFLDFSPGTPFTQPEPFATGLYGLLARDPAQPLGETFSIRFDFKGPLYGGRRIQNPDPLLGSDPLNDLFQIVGISAPPPGTDSFPGLPFQITRGPVRSSTPPLQMPGNTVIDLSVSGVAGSGNEFDSVLLNSGPPAVYTASPLIIMFNPAGTVDFVFYNNQSFPALGSIHLLIGRNIQVVNPAVANFQGNSPLPNLTDSASRWISISHRTGEVTTAENVNTLPLTLTVPERILAARSIARSSVGQGGR